MTIYGALEILFHLDEYQRLYNCSIYDVDSIPQEKRVKPYLGAVYIVLFVIYQGCHVICLPVIWKRMKDSSYYKIMLFMSVLDISCLPVIALGSGIFMFAGTVFCSNPTLMYALGAPTPGTSEHVKSASEAIKLFSMVVHQYGGSNRSRS
ncbi:CRE-SRT-24 protein [Aphelenchoides avenae]|nr:CRE-SRT-24 protein [Aphelenchus avenae]